MNLDHLAAQRIRAAGQRGHLSHRGEMAKLCQRLVVAHAEPMPPLGGALRRLLPGNVDLRILG